MNTVKRIAMIKANVLKLKLTLKNENQAKPHQTPHPLTSEALDEILLCAHLYSVKVDCS